MSAVAVRVRVKKDSPTVSLATISIEGTCSLARPTIRFVSQARDGDEVSRTVLWLHAAAGIAG